jgi:hypothetical protein
VNSEVTVDLAEEAADETVGKVVSAGDAENPKDWLVILNVFILPLFNNVAISPMWKPGTSEYGHPLAQ